MFRQGFIFMEGVLNNKMNSNYEVTFDCANCQNLYCSTNYTKTTKVKETYITFRL